MCGGFKHKNVIFLTIQYRDASSLRLKYEGIKKLLRGTKSELFQTGGGPQKKAYTASSEYENQLLDIIQLSVEGLPSIFDNDDSKLF